MSETLYFTGQVNSGLSFTGSGTANQLVATGSVAVAGPQGPTGPQGPQGVPGTSGGGTWGSITGTLSSQTDLQSALLLKANSASLATVATSGSYTDLSNKPTIPTANSQLTNDSSYATTTALSSGLATKANTTHTHTESDVTGLTTDLAAKQATLVSGTNIKTVNGNSLLGSGDVTIAGGTWGSITGTLSNQTDLNTALNAKAATTYVDTQDALKAPALNPTAVKTANYTAVANDFVPVDTTSGNITITLPSAPANGTRVGIKHVTRGGTNTITVTRGGTDVFNKTSGNTSITVTVLDQAIQYQYFNGIWYGIAGDIGLTALDARYQAAGSYAPATGIAESAVTNLTTDLAAKLPLVGGMLTGTLTSQQVTPSTNATYSLGTTALYWSNLYASRLNLNSTAYFDGSTAGVITANSNRIAAVADPTSAQDVATKNYVDTHSGGGTTVAEWVPSSYGYLSWAYDPALAVNQTALTPAGTMYVVKLIIPASMTVTNIVMHVIGAGVTLTSGQCFAALYQNGTLVGSTADQSTNWAATGAKIMPLTGGPFTLSSGTAYVAFWYNGTTGPTLARSVSAPVGNASLATTASRFGTANTALTTTAPTTLGTIAATSTAYWVAIS